MKTKILFPLLIAGLFLSGCYSQAELSRNNSAEGYEANGSSNYINSYSNNGHQQTSDQSLLDEEQENSKEGEYSSSKNSKKYTDNSKNPDNNVYVDDGNNTVILNNYSTADISGGSYVYGHSHFSPFYNYNYAYNDYWFPYGQRYFGYGYANNWDDFWYFDNFWNPPVFGFEIGYYGWNFPYYGSYYSGYYPDPYFSPYYYYNNNYWDYVSYNTYTPSKVRYRSNYKYNSRDRHDRHSQIDLSRNTVEINSRVLARSRSGRTITKRTGIRRHNVDIKSSRKSRNNVTRNYIRAKRNRDIHNIEKKRYFEKKRFIKNYGKNKDRFSEISSLGRRYVRKNNTSVRSKREVIKNFKRENAYTLRNRKYGGINKRETRTHYPVNYKKSSRTHSNKRNTRYKNRRFAPPVKSYPENYKRNYTRPRNNSHSSSRSYSRPSSRSSSYSKSYSKPSRTYSTSRSYSRPSSSSRTYSRSYSKPSSSSRHSSSRNSSRLRSR